MFEIEEEALKKRFQLIFYYIKYITQKLRVLKKKHIQKKIYQYFCFPQLYLFKFVRLIIFSKVVAFFDNLLLLEMQGDNTLWGETFARNYYPFSYQTYEYPSYFTYPYFWNYSPNNFPQYNY